MTKQSHGVISHASVRRTDYLYRVSLKCLVRNEHGEVLVVKESGRSWWDLPGGGMDHGEDLKTAIAREMAEEVAMTGDFDYRVIAVDEPAHLDRHNFWQVRLIFEITPHTMQFAAGDDSDEVVFILPETLKDSSHVMEQRVHFYSQLL